MPQVMLSTSGEKQSVIVTFRAGEIGAAELYAQLATQFDESKKTEPVVESAIDDEPKEPSVDDTADMT